MSQDEGKNWGKAEGVVQGRKDVTTEGVDDGGGGTVVKGAVIEASSPLNMGSKMDCNKDGRGSERPLKIVSTSRVEPGKQISK